MDFGTTGITLDGDNLVCEGVEKGKYHIVDRDDPELSYETLCWYVLSLSGLDVKKAWRAYHGDEVASKKSASKRREAHACYRCER